MKDIAVIAGLKSQAAEQRQAGSIGVPDLDLEEVDVLQASISSSPCRRRVMKEI